MAHILRAQREQDICVFIGRFQPLHAGHLWVILHALQCAEFVILVIGSANAPRRPDTNPFFSSEREAMLWAALPTDVRERVRIIQVEDSDFNGAEWCERVYTQVSAAAAEMTSKTRVSLVGHAKDHSSYYLKMFPQWGSIDVASAKDLNATDFRMSYFSTNNDEVEAMFKRAAEYELLPVSTINWLRDFQKTEDYVDQVEELAFYMRARARFANESYPFSRNTVTGDAMIHQHGNVLLIRRNERPFKGLWALPGGHLNIDETVMDCALREGYEETKIKVPRAVFERSLVGQDYFDQPNRDPRGRYITHTFLFNLTPNAPDPDPSKSAAENKRRVRDALALPKVKLGGSEDEEDDAAEAKFWHTSQITRQMMAFDHYPMIRKMLATHLPKQD